MQYLVDFTHLLYPSDKVSILSNHRFDYIIVIYSMWIMGDCHIAVNNNFFNSPLFPLFSSIISFSL